MAFEELEGSIPQPNTQLTAEDVAFQDEQLEDAAALSIVLQDTQSSEAYLSAKSLITALDSSDDFYRAYVKPRNWPGTDTPRANLGMPVVLEAIERILPTLHMPLFAKNPPFFLEPIGKTTPDVARAKQHLLAWAVKQAGFKEEIRRSLKTALQYGFMVGNWGWQTTAKKVKTYQRQPDGSIKRTIKEIEISQPTYECMDLRKVLVDPACDTQDVRKSAKFIIKQIFITANDLDALREDEAYKNIPSREELAVILTAQSEPTVDSLKASKTNSFRDLQAEAPDKATSADPLQQPLELLEYWTNDRVITVLQRMIVIRNEENEFGRLPFVSCAFIDVLNSAWGFGVAKLLAGEQRLQQAVVNSWIDSLALALNPVYQILKGTAPGAQQIKVAPGKVITESGELKPLVVPSVTGEAMNAIAASEVRAGRRVAANSGSAMPSQALRTAEGIQSFTGDVIQRLQYFLEIFVELVFVPVLEAFLEMCADHLTPEQVNEILSETDGKAYVGDITDVYNGTCNVSVLSGTKLTAKVAAAQLIPMFVNLVSAQPFQDSLTQQGKKFNYAELLEQACELMDYNVDSLIVDMTQEDMQRAQMLNAAAAKAAGEMQLEQQKHENDLENIEAKGMAQAGVAIIRNAVKGHMDEALSTLQEQQSGLPEGVTNG